MLGWQSALLRNLSLTCPYTFHLFIHPTICVSFIYISLSSASLSSLSSAPSFCLSVSVIYAKCSQVDSSAGTLAVAASYHKTEALALNICREHFQSKLGGETTWFDCTDDCNFLSHLVPEPPEHSYAWRIIHALRGNYWAGVGFLFSLSRCSLTVW